MLKKETLSVRIPPELMAKIDGIVAKTRRSKTSVAVEVIERGVQFFDVPPVDSERFVTAERFEEVVTHLRQEVAELKKLELVA